MAAMIHMMTAASMLALLVVCLVACVAGYRVEAPSSYVALVGDVTDVEWELSGVDDDVIPYKLHVVTSGTTVFTQSVTAGHLAGTLAFPCGLIDSAGQYLFKLVRYKDGMPGAEVAVSSPMTVKWPPIIVHLPANMEALTHDLTMTLTVTTNLCVSRHSEARYTVGLYYYSSRETLENSHSVKGAAVYTQEYPRVSRFLNSSVDIPCEKIDREGYCVADITSHRSSGAAMATSNTLHVTWSKSYSLSTPARSIFPCNNQFPVSYTHAQCSSAEDKIRLFKRVKVVASSAASPLSERYLSEQRIVIGLNTVNFTCFQFDQNALQYCFKYVSSSLISEAVTEQYELCLPLKDQQDSVVNGGWGEWTSWSDCSATCGTGQQTRFRVCDTPLPSGGGAFCAGSTNQARTCELPCRSTSTIPPPTYTPNPNCPCGCVTSSLGGQIIGSSRCKGSSVWKLHAPSTHVMELKFEVFSLDIRNLHTFIKVKDGEASFADMLLRSNGGSIPPTIRSKQSTMVVELYSPQQANSGYDDSQGVAFVATYTAIPRNSSTVIVTDSGGGSSVWESTVTIVGIVLCGVIIITTIAFVCHHRLARKRKREKQSTAANQALLVNGEVANSPTHSGNSYQGSANVSFGDPSATSPARVEGHGRREHALARGTNTHSPHIGRKGAQGVVTPTSIRSASSPYAANAATTDWTHDVDMLKASPLPPEAPDKRHRRTAARDRHRTKAEVDQPYRRPRSPTKHSSSAPRHSHKHEPSSPTKRHRSKSRSPSKPTKPEGPPIACEEDLTPTSPVSPMRRKFSDRLKQEANKMDPIRESIQMDQLHERKKNSKLKEEEYSPTEIPTTRPPVEGRDSLGRKYKELGPTPKGTTGMVVDLPPVTGKYSANDAENGNVPAGKPHIKALPLRGVQRPDGQSPEHKPHEPNANTPGSYVSADLSSLVGSGKLYLDQNSASTPGDFVCGQDEFEYDDYIPELPGSYFTMDPHAYTLTWSQQTPWAQKGGAMARAASDLSLDKAKGPSNSNC